MSTIRVCSQDILIINPILFFDNRHCANQTFYGFTITKFTILFRFTIYFMTLFN